MLAQSGDEFGLEFEDGKFSAIQRGTRILTNIHLLQQCCSLFTNPTESSPNSHRMDRDIVPWRISLFHRALIRWAGSMRRARGCCS
jgi:hypothetical protein